MKSVRKSQQELTKEWDSIAKIRFLQISTGLDLSFSKVLVPSLLSNCKLTPVTRALDVGCGTGFLAKELASKVKCVTGVDDSSHSIEIAKKYCEDEQNIEFVQQEFSIFAMNATNTFDLVVANMTLMTAMNLPAMLTAIGKVLRKEGQLVFTITHPCFWPLYKGYLSEKWFSYWEEIQIETSFDISLQKQNSAVTTHIHRSLENYMSALITAGFVITGISEPKPQNDVMLKYPEPWQYPRFLLLQCSYSQAKKNTRLDVTLMAP